MKEKPEEGGYCPYCGFNNERYKYLPNQLPPLTVLKGKYLLGRPLGVGSVGITYIALDLRQHAVVAIKELYTQNVCIREQPKSIYVNEKDKAVFEASKRRFLQEARVLTMFKENDKEGIVKVKDHFEENNTAYIVMEYLDGKSLAELVKESRMTFEQTRSLFESICHALTKIHQFGVVHLDVRPNNIMVMENGTVKLLDFGDVNTIGKNNLKGITAIKIGFAAPEQYMKNGKIGQWTDVYATAATMYYCLTGKRPADFINRKAGAELEKPSKLGVKIPTSAETAILKAMELNPSDRFRTMDEFWNAFDNKKKQKKKKKRNGGLKPGIVAGTIAAAVAVIAIAALLLHKPITPEQHENDSVSVSELPTSTTTITNVPEPETTENDSVSVSESSMSTTTVTNAPEPEMDTVEVGETMPMYLGTYILENAADRNYIMGIDGGFGDDGTALTVKAYEDSNKNRISVTEEAKEDGFYNLRAAHTNSYIETSESQDIGETVRQFAKLFDSGTEKWAFVYCGHDDDKDMDEVIIQNAAGSVLAPKDGNVKAGTEIVLTEFNMDDNSQKWYMRWSEKDENEANVIVYHEGDLVESISGVFNISSALDGKTSMSISRDTVYHPEPTAVVFYSDWLTTEDTLFQFEFVPTGSESRYKIFPVDQKNGEHKCLEYNPDTRELVMRDESDNKNQLFRVVYVKSNTYLLQTFDESVVGFDLDEKGEAIGVAVLARPYNAIADSRLESWLLGVPHSK